MKPALHLLLLFLQPASTFPIPIGTLSPSKHYIYNSYTPSKQAISLPSISTRLPSPQLSPDNSLPSKIIDNTPLLQPKYGPTTISLTAFRPLVSSYILYLSTTSPTLSKDLEALPAKPTSALASLRKEDMKQYWKSLQLTAEAIPSRKSNNVQVPQMTHLCAEMKVSSRRWYFAQEYSDIIVLGVVVLFLVLTVVVECINASARDRAPLDSEGTSVKGFVNINRCHYCELLGSISGPILAASC
jgi:hypothetical protein